MQQKYLALRLWRFNWSFCFVGWGRFAGQSSRVWQAVWSYKTSLGWNKHCPCKFCCLSTLQTSTTGKTWRCTVREGEPKQVWIITVSGDETCFVVFSSVGQEGVYVNQPWHTVKNCLSPLITVFCCILGQSSQSTFEFCWGSGTVLCSVSCLYDRPTETTCQVSWRYLLYNFIHIKHQIFTFILCEDHSWNLYFGKMLVAGIGFAYALIL